MFPSACAVAAYCRDCQREPGLRSPCSYGGAFFKLQKGHESCLPLFTPIHGGGLPFPPRLLDRQAYRKEGGSFSATLAAVRAAAVPLPPLFPMTTTTKTKRSSRDTKSVFCCKCPSEGGRGRKGLSSSSNFKLLVVVVVVGVLHINERCFLGPGLESWP